MLHNEFQRDGGAYLLRNPAFSEQLPAWLFEPAELERRGRLQATSDGRRQTWFMAHAGLDLVLRHYWRGGMVAVFSADVYVWNGLRRTRPVAEYCLLRRLGAMGLPVPEGIAARVQPVNPLSYRGDLITRAIPRASSLADRILAGQDDRELWALVGRTIASFHRAGAVHADLNVRNILVDETAQVWLIDWDRGSLRGGKRHRRANVSRLRRSLAREERLDERAHQAWPHLQRAYHNAMAD
jgi:3-deoxy-D-manno-octulosonic acid kinase